MESRVTETKMSATITTTSASAAPGVSVHHFYFCSSPGIVKVIQAIFAIICMGCASPVLTNYTHFFMFVVATCFIITVLLCFFYLFSIQDLLTRIPWLFLELSFTFGATILYAIAAIVQLAITSRTDYYLALRHYGYLNAYLAAGCFGLFNAVAYGVGLLFLYQDWRQQRQVAN